MPAQQSIANPKGAFGLPLSGTNLGGQTVMSNDVVEIEVVNNSAGARNYGDVIVVDVTGTLGNTTTTANDVTKLGVVSQYNQNLPVPVGFPMKVVIAGVARVNIAANPVVSHDVLASSGVAAVAISNNALTVATFPAAIGIALEAAAAKDTNNTIRAKIGAI